MWTSSWNGISTRKRSRKKKNHQICHGWLFSVRRYRSYLVSIDIVCVKQHCWLVKPSLWRDIRNNYWFLSARVSHDSPAAGFICVSYFFVKLWHTYFISIYLNKWNFRISFNTKEWFVSKIYFLNTFSNRVMRIILIYL